MINALMLSMQEWDKQPSRFCRRKDFEIEREMPSDWFNGHHPDMR